MKPHITEANKIIYFCQKVNSDYQVIDGGTLGDGNAIEYQG